MRSSRRSLILAGCVLASVTGYMAYSGASSSWQYYLTVDECLAHSPSEANIRVSGTISPGSLRVSPARDHAVFLLKGERGKLRITCRGRLPDNLEENTEVVAEGQLRQDGELIARQVLTRCASKYTAGDVGANGGGRED